MANVAAARRYAQAAFDLARERGEVSRWRSDLADIATLLVDSQLAPILADPKIPLEQRFAALERVLEVSPLALNLAKLLVQKGRSLDARAVAEAFNRLADEFEGIAHAQVTTAVPLSEERLQEIARRIGEQLGKQVVATNRVDPSIIGGAVIRVGDRLIDGSIRTRLKALRRELEGAR